MEYVHSHIITKRDGPRGINAKVCGEPACQALGGRSAKKGMTFIAQPLMSSLRLAWLSRADQFSLSLSSRLPGVPDALGAETSGFLTQRRKIT